MDASALEKAEIIPEVVPEVTNEAQISVAYPKVGEIYPGMELTPKQAADEPEIKLSGTRDGLYTLMNVDPDVPSPSNKCWKFFLHWWVVNIPEGDVKRGEVISEYVGPAPPEGKHRYTFLLYKQPGKLQVERPKLRAAFPLRQIEHEQKLSKALGANFFYSYPHVA